MNEKEFAELIRRCLSGEASSEEASLLEKWLELRAERKLADEIPPEEKEAIKAAMFARLASKIKERDVPETRANRTRPTTFYRAAAAIALLCLLSYSLLTWKPDSIVEKVTVIHSLSTGASKKIILSDNSIVWLKGNSSIVYPEEFDRDARNVTLTGEALFEVSKDLDHPFIIACGGLTAKVLGTSFNIKSSKDDIEVFVLTGKVALSSKGNNEALIVNGNEKAVYHTAADQMAKVGVTEAEKTEKISGTEYSMRFHATRMKEIIRRIEGKFEVTVSLSDPRLNNCTITADFTDQSLDRTLSMISQTLDIDYEIAAGKVTLRGTGCD